MDKLLFQEGDLRRFLDEVKNKMGVSWDVLGASVGVSGRTIRDWRREKFKPSQRHIVQLSGIAQVNIPPSTQIPQYGHIQNAAKLGGLKRALLHGSPGTPEGRSKAGKNSWLKRRADPALLKRFTKSITSPVESVDLAEFMGIMLGDGGLTKFQCSVYLHSEIDREYASYVQDLIKKLFNVESSIYFGKKSKVLRISVSGVNLVEYLTRKGLSVGNKVHLQADVPGWILKNPSFSKTCLRGLIDTDGCFVKHRYLVNGKEYAYSKISFSNRSEPLLAFVYRELERLGLSPKRSYQYQVWLHGTQDIVRYFDLVGVRNIKPGVIFFVEGCPSGLRGQFAKLLARKRHTGSNPVSSA